MITKTGIRVLLIAPAALLLAFIVVYGVNGPLWDHLASAEIFDRWYTHRLTFDFLFSQNMEHRKAVPRLVVLALGLATRFNNKAEMVLQWALLAATVAVMFRAFREDVASSGTFAVVAFVPIAWMMFSLRPYEVLLVGDGLLTYLSMAFLVGALYLLTRDGSRWTTLSAAAAAGTLASYSQSNGLLVWPIGSIMFAAESHVRTGALKRQARIRLAIWTLVGIAVLAAYFHGYVDPPNHVSPRSVIERPVAAAQFFTMLGGASLAPERSSAMVMGLVLVGLEALFAVALWRWWARDGELPPFGAWLTLVAIATDVMITANRATSAAGSLTPRYAAYSCLAPIGVYWCAVARRDRIRAGGTLAAVVGTLLVAGYLAGSIDTWKLRNRWYADKWWRAYELYAARYQPASSLNHLYPNAEQARVYAESLERYRLNVFAEPRVDPRGLPPPSNPPRFELQLVDGLPPRPHETLVVTATDLVTLRGWALDADGRRAVSAVFVDVDDAVELPGCVGLERDTNGESLPRSLKWTGFGASFGGFVVPPGRHSIALKIVPSDRQSVFVTGPLLTIERN